MNNHQQFPNGNALEIRQGQCFQYVVPPGWRVAEDGQFAIVLTAPDNQAITIVVGNSGLPPYYHPGQFVYEKLMAMQPQQLQMSQPRPANPIAGCNAAYEFDYTYFLYGMPCRGVAKCSVAQSYGMSTMIMTAAASTIDQWGNYASWLPQIAERFSSTNGNAFGMRGVAIQNLDNSMREGQQAQEYRNWSQQTWAEVARQRDESNVRQNFQFRENLGNVGTWTNPYGYPTVELPTSHQYYWTNRQGQIYGTNDPSENPNVGSTGDWVQMRRHQS